MSDLVPNSGPARWRYYGLQAIRDGISRLWTAFSVIFGVGVIAIVTFVAKLSALWIVLAVLAALVLIVSVGGYELWFQLQQRPAPTLPSDPIEQLRGQLAHSYGIGASGVLGREPERIHDDLLYLWARQTWSVLKLYDPYQAREFYGPTEPYGEAYFMLAFSVASANRQSYLSSRQRILETILTRHANRGTAV